MTPTSKLLLGVAAALVAALVGACGAGDRREAGEQAAQREPAATAPAFHSRSAVALWRALPSGWSSLAPPPFARTGAVSVWIGSGLFYWGGDSSSDAADGAIYSPISNRWRALPPSPLSGRSGAGAVWTGSEVLIWGGQAAALRGDGAAFNPITGSWRLLPEAPLTPRQPVGAVWTGTEMIVWGSTSRPAGSTDGAAYDPNANRWRRIAPAPFALNLASAVWTGEEMIVYGALLDGNNWSKSEQAQGAAYSPATNTWRVVALFQLSPQASTAAWTGRNVLTWDYELKAATYDPVRDAWSALSDLPLDFSECYPTSARAGAVVLAWYCGRGATFGISRRTWRPLPPPPDEIAGTPVSAGPVVLFVGAAGNGSSTALWAYKPD